jgi:hypothetical protein
MTAWFNLKLSSANEALLFALPLDTPPYRSSEQLIKEFVPKIARAPAAKRSEGG